MRGTWIGSGVLALVAGAMLAAHGQAGEKKAAKAGEEQIKGELNAKDPPDKGLPLPGMPHKVFPFKATKGSVYKIQMNAEGKTLDPYLRLEDANGKQLASDDDGGGGLNARILFRAPADGEYKVIATSLPIEVNPETKKPVRPEGRFTLTIAPIQWKKFLAEQLKPLRDKADEITGSDAQRAMMFAMSLEAGSPDLAADAYNALGKILARSSNGQIERIARMMKGAARRMELPGNAIDVFGKTLEGKDLDWKAYRGKVVLVDFWATWCGPCVAELPNVKRMYDKYHERGFDVVAISIDQGKPAPTKFMEARKLPWICLFDNDAGKGKETLADHYGIFSIPRPILVDRDGKVVSMNARGPELERLLERHIGPSKSKNGDDAK